MENGYACSAAGELFPSLVKLNRSQQLIIIPKACVLCAVRCESHLSLSIHLSALEFVPLLVRGQLTAHEPCALEPEREREPESGQATAEPVVELAAQQVPGIRAESTTTTTTTASSLIGLVF